ncbi:MAG TPA: hypothetical protein VL094_13150 [Sphingomonadaceae bacterium]|nr:hypothetical protein [Sphingomonadaceae bacterium]
MVEGAIGSLGPLPGIADLAASLTLPVIAMFGGGALLGFFALTFPRLRYLFTRFRLRRRLRRDSFMLREEMAEYRYGQEEEAPAEIELDRLVWSMLVGAVAVGGPYLLDEAGLHFWYMAGGGLIFVGWLLVWAWRRFNDPPELQEPLVPDVTIPQEAVLGALSAVAIIVFALAMLVWVVF